MPLHLESPIQIRENSDSEYLLLETLSASAYVKCRSAQPTGLQARAVALLVTVTLLLACSTAAHAAALQGAASTQDPSAPARRTSDSSKPIPESKQTPQRYPIKLPAGNLHDSLISLGRQTRNSILFERDSVKEAQHAPISGTYSVAEVLDLLIGDHCLEFSFIRDRFVTITPSCKQATAPKAVTNPSLVVENASTPSSLPPPAIEEMTVTERILTGSRVRNSAFGETMPLDVIDQTEIRLSGFQSIGELLRYVPAVSGNSTSTLISNGGDGTATVTLRGLPASNTLVLLNGRRLNTDALRGQAVDLNTLPLGIVERIEILKDGVSAIYGSDAIAGVVNIITDQDFSGLKFDAYYGQAAQGDLSTENYTIQFGTGTNRWSITGGLSYYDQSGLFSRDRSLSASSDDRARGGIDKRSSATSPARFSLPGVGPMILATGAQGNTIADYRPATSEDRFEYRHFTSSIVPSERINGYVRADIDMPNEWHTYAELLYSQTDATSSLAPVPIFTAFESRDLTIPAEQIYNPYGVDIFDLRRRVVELPPRLQINDTESYRSIIGTRKETRKFNIEFALQFSRTEAKETFRNGIHGGRLAQALAVDCQNECVPINLFGPAGSISQPMLAFIGTDSSISGTSEMLGLTTDFDLVLKETSNGKIELSGGLEYRHESLNTNPDEVLANNLLIAGGNRSSIDGARDVFELYTEIFVPLAKDARFAKRVDMQIATRVSRYSDFGYAVNPRLVVSWLPVESLTLRSSVARGFRAPSLLQLHGSRQQSFEQLNDPCSIASNVGSFVGCLSLSDETLTQYQVINGGDKDLDPERSLTFSLGALWEHQWSTQSISASFDWFTIEQRDVVESSAQFIVNRNARSGVFDNRVTRNAAGNISQVLATLQNIGRREVSGFDVTSSYTIDSERYGLLTFALNATHIKKFEDKFDPDSPTLDKAGTFSDEASGGLGSLPDWKLNAAISWQKNNWQGHYNFYRVSAVDETVPLTERRRTIDSWQTHNINLSYLGSATRWIRVTLGVNNVLDTQPPFASAAFNDSYDGRTYDITGRYAFLKLDTTI